METQNTGLYKISKLHESKDILKKHNTKWQFGNYPQALRIKMSYNSLINTTVHVRKTWYYISLHFLL